MLSELANGMKEILVDSEDEISTPEIFLTNAATKEIVQLCMLPEKINVKTAASFRSFNVIERGEVKIPKGEQLQAVSWSGIFPSARMWYYPFVKLSCWEKPNEVLKALNRWRECGDKIRLLVTTTPLNLDVYIKTLDWKHQGAHGHIYYEVGFLASKPLQVLTVAEADKRRDDSKERLQYEIKRRADAKTKSAIYFGWVNTAYEAVKILTGKGGDWESVLEGSGIKDPTQIKPEDAIIYM